jgi:hypothetical protein
VTSVRNIGGKFDLGWNALQHRLAGVVEYSIGKGRMNLVLATYHYAKGDSHRGCRGHAYDADAARANARDLVNQIDEIFGQGREQVDAIMVGVETDDESLVFHDRAGDRAVSMTEFGSDDERDFRRLIGELYPDMRAPVAEDLLPLVRGSVLHLRKLSRTKRTPVQIEHTERILAIGDGFDWLHRPNYALIINDFDPQMDDAIAAGAKIIEENAKAGRIPRGGALLFACAPYARQGHFKAQAIRRARYLTQLGQETLKKHHPHLTKTFRPLTGVVDLHTRELEIVD